jgi:hypothetical protein
MRAGASFEKMTSFGINHMTNCCDDKEEVHFGVMNVMSCDHPGGHSS